MVAYFVNNHGRWNNLVPLLFLINIYCVLSFVPVTLHTLYISIHPHISQWVGTSLVSLYREGTMWVISGCQNKILQTEWLKQYVCLLTVLKTGKTRSRHWQGWPRCLVRVHLLGCRWLLSYRVLTWPLRVCMEREEAPWCPLIRTLPLWAQDPSLLFFF